VTDLDYLVAERLSSNSGQVIRRYLVKRNNPWELLAIAALVFVPSIVMLLTEPMIAFPEAYGSAADQRPRYAIEFISPGVAHVFGIIRVTFAFFIACFYFYTRRAIARDLRTGDKRSSKSSN